MKPKGRLVIGIWGNPEDSESSGVLKAVVDALPAPPPGGGPFALSAPGVMEGLLEETELRILDRGEVDAPFVYQNLEAAWRAMRSAGPVQGALRVVGEEKLRSAVVGALKPFEKAGGGVRLENRFRYFTTTRR